MADQFNFSGMDFEPTRRELSSAFNLPPEMYTSIAAFAAEKKAIFSREWIYACRADQVPNPGDYWTTQIAAAPLVIVRDNTGGVRAHSAVCRHKGAVVVEGHGNAKAFRCPYHGWTYSLDGQLVAAPLMNKTKDFARCEYGLIGIRSEVWEGLVFVNLSSDAPSLAPKLDPLSARFAKYRLWDMVCTRSLEYEAQTNWKLYVGNSMEEYHVPVTHAKTLQPTFPMGGHVSEPPTSSSYQIRTVAAKPFGSPFPRIPGLEDDTTITALIFPNLIVSAAPDSFYTFDFIPVEASLTRVRVDIYFPKGTVAWPDFSEHARSHYDGLDVVLKEDNVIVASTHRGLTSPLSTRGRYAPREEVVHRLDNYVLDRLVELA
jgi:choline monooxygenase